MNIEQFIDVDKYMNSEEQNAHDDCVADFSGRLYLGLNNADAGYGTKPELVNITFYCGPEMKDGALCDYLSMNGFLEKAFGKWPTMVIGAAENYHECNDVPPDKVDETWNKIIEIISHHMHNADVEIDLEREAQDC